MNIELFPAEKTCEQGCKICPLARQSGTIMPSEINPDVQKSFSIIQNLLKEQSTSYNLHTTSISHLFPKLEHPELVEMIRFETGKEVRMPGNTKYFSEGIRALLVDHNIKPKVIGFSLVPEFPLVSEKDMTTLKEIIDEISSWYFLEDDKKIEVTLRSNFIKMFIFEKIIPLAFETDESYIKPLIQDYGLLSENRKQEKPFDFTSGSRMYQNEYTAMIGKNTLEINNRIIGVRKTEDIRKENAEQAEMLYPKTIGNVNLMGFAIAPKGIMINHASVAINNPILWLSHSDFEKTLMLEREKLDFSILRLMQNIVRKNWAMYDTLPKYVKNGVVLTNDIFMALFEEYRPKIKDPVL